MTASEKSPRFKRTQLNLVGRSASAVKRLNIEQLVVAHRHSVDSQITSSSAQNSS